MARQEAVGPAALELPLEMPAVTLTNPDLGLTTLAFGGSGTLVSTVVDVADARLLRTGAMLIRIPATPSGGPAGQHARPEEWELTLPEWLEIGPAAVDRSHFAGASEPLGGDGHAPVVPPELADRLTPLVRNGSLTDLATRSVKRTRWLIRGGSGTAAVLVDDTVTLRRHEIAVARYREATIEAVGCSARALAWLCDSLETAGATLLDEPVPLPVRLGAPATGLPDLPDPDPVLRSDPAAGVFASMIRSDARELWSADLAVRDGADRGVSTLHRSVVALASDLRVFAGMLADDAIAEVVNDLAWLDDQLAELRNLGALRKRLGTDREEFAGLEDVMAANELAARRRLTSTLGLPRYRRMLDGLVRLARNPGAALLRDEQGLVASAELPAHTWLADALTHTLGALGKRLRRADRAGREIWTVWRDVQAQAAAVEVLGRATVLLEGDHAGAYARATRKLRRESDRVAAAAGCSRAMRELALRGSATDPAVVFALGRASAEAATDASSGTDAMIRDFARQRRALQRKAGRS